MVKQIEVNPIAAGVHTLDINKQGMDIWLGPLEKRIMDVVWGSGRKTFSIRDVYEEFRSELAYTTIATTINRLRDKGVLVKSYSRVRNGRDRTWEAAVDQEGFTQLMIDRTISSLRANFPGQFDMALELEG